MEVIITEGVNKVGVKEIREVLAEKIMVILVDLLD